MAAIVTNKSNQINAKLLLFHVKGLKWERATETEREKEAEKRLFHAEHL